MPHRKTTAASITEKRAAATTVPQRAAAKPAAPLPSRWLIIGGITLIVAAAAASYFSSLSGGMIWDDEAHVTKPELRSLDGLYRIWFDVGATQQYYPLLHSAFWIEHQLWGDNTLGYHLMNLLQHLAVAWLVYLILRKLRIPGAYLAAAIFALHPVMVESVAWITEQKNTLSALFYFWLTGYRAHQSVPPDGPLQTKGN